jgi:hypothetical protein
MFQGILISLRGFLFLFSAKLQIISVFGANIKVWKNMPQARKLLRIHLLSATFLPDAYSSDFGSCTKYTGYLQELSCLYTLWWSSGTQDNSWIKISEVIVCQISEAYLLMEGVIGAGFLLTRRGKPKLQSTLETTMMRCVIVEYIEKLVVYPLTCIIPS